jgi:3-hydroxyisobutyrate dehydrogenase-like beta-hydroxyacid dehydrogenase
MRSARSPDTVMTTTGGPSAATGTGGGVSFAAVKARKPEAMSATLARIRPTLNYGDFKEVDIIIEAVVENPKVKKAVFAEVEGLVRDDTIIASNTSTISISGITNCICNICYIMYIC